MKIIFKLVNNENYFLSELQLLKKEKFNKLDKILLLLFR